VSASLPPDSIGAIFLAAAAELAQAEQDLRKPARYTTARDCAECDGTGNSGLLDEGGDLLPCPACHGSGEMSPEREAELRDEDAAGRHLDFLEGIGERL
jgi:DnaJ-class molecular chaperone